MNAYYSQRLFCFKHTCTHDVSFYLLTYLLSHPFRARRTHKAVIAPPPFPIGIKWRLDLRLIISFHKKQTITETDASSWWALKYFDYLCVCFQLNIIFFSNSANCIKKARIKFAFNLGSHMTECCTLFVYVCLYSFKGVGHLLHGQFGHLVQWPVVLENVKELVLVTCL